MTYTARSDAGPSNTAVIPSTVTVAASLATYLESPLLYSFPENGRTQPLISVQPQYEYIHDGDDNEDLQTSSKKFGFSFLKKWGVKMKGPSMSMWVNPVNAHQHMSRRSVLDNLPHLPAGNDMSWAEYYARTWRPKHAHDTDKQINFGSQISSSSINQTLVVYI
jgi:hypothetical protein